MYLMVFRFIALASRNVSLCNVYGLKIESFIKSSLARDPDQLFEINLKKSDFSV